MTMSIHPGAAPAGTLPGLGEAEFRALAQVAAPPAAAARRGAAFDAYRAAPSPAPRDEEWRRTDPGLFIVDGFARLPDLRPGAPPGAAADGDAADVVVSVSERGYSIEDRAGALRDGRIAVTALGEAEVADPGSVGGADAEVASANAPRKFERLNAAFWNFGVLVRAARSAGAPCSVRFVYRIEAVQALFMPRVLVTVDDGAQLRVAEQMESPDGVPMMCVGSRRFAVGRDAALAWAIVQNWGDRTLHLSEDWGHVARGGRVDWIAASLGGSAGKLMLGCDLREPGADARLSGLYLTAGRQHVDQRTLQLHSAPDTTSHVLYKGAVRDASRSVYQGIIKAKPGAIRVDAYQMNNNLILNDGARADSLPGLEIDADDLKCSHGATTGSLDPDQVYYLRTRGLTEAAATDLVIAGFYEDVVSRIPFPVMQEHVRGLIHDKRRVS